MASVTSVSSVGGVLLGFEPHELGAAVRERPLTATAFSLCVLPPFTA